jgi:hypothetical protein
MEKPGGESTDGSSIVSIMRTNRRILYSNSMSQKPVSSLRSHFENMLSANASASPSPTISRQPSPFHDHPSRLQIEEPQSRPVGRISLDLPREGIHSQNYQHGAVNNKLTTHNPSTVTPRTPQLKPRPISMGPMSPPRSPPLVTVDSPRSPPKQAESTSYTTVTSRSPNSIAQEHVTLKSGSPGGTRHFRIPSRSTTPNIEASPIPSMHIPTSESVSGDPRKPLQTGKEVSIRSHQNAGTGVPPPINRAGKPKIATKPAQLQNTAEKSLLAPDSAVEPPDERVSPFSTPPSSDDSPADGVSALPRADVMKPKNGMSKAPRESYFPARPITRAETEQFNGGNSRSVHRILAPPPVMSESNRRQALESDRPEDRPGLPPRREQHELRSTTIRAPPPEPPVRRSMDTPNRTATLIAETDSKFMPPPRRTHTNPVGYSISRNSSETTLVPSRASVDTSRSSVTLARQPERYDEDSDDVAEAVDKGRPLLTDFPDSSQANRRPPTLRLGPNEIPTKYETKLFAICGEYICTTGYVTRVWSLLTGELLMSLAHGENIKVTAIAFRPAKDVEDEGKRIWLGSNTGEIYDVDVSSQKVVYTKSNAHPRREIIKMYRYASEMWTLDDDGKIHIWPQDESGSPSLGQVPHNFRVPKGHTSSIITGNNLWIATGKDIRVFQRTPNTYSFTQVLQRPLSQNNVGEVTSAAMISSQPDQVYFGHADGKVTIYDRNDYSCRAVISVSLYKISSLVGVGDYLWAGFNTGMIYVYDTRVSPWKVMKDWHAHDKPIAGILVDRTSIWKLDRLQVASLGTDNMLRIWDGMLEEDWLGKLAIFVLLDLYTESFMQRVKCRKTMLIIATFAKLRPWR